MNRYKVIIQRTLFKQNEVITEKNRTFDIFVNASSYVYKQDEVEITEKNIEYAQRNINKNYKLGDIHKGPRKAISFYDNNNNKILKSEKNNYPLPIKIFADPYFKLYKWDENNEEWILIDKHNCE